MRRLFISIAALGLACLTWAEPFYVLVNDQDAYLASPTGAADFQGRTQYAAMCVPLKANDVLKCYDKGNEAKWAINAIDEGDTWGAPGFTASSSGLTCSIEGNYNIYIKLKFEDDIWYVETASDCTPANPNNPDEETPYTTSAPSQYPGVMLQGFYWDSYRDKGHGATKWTNMLKDTTEVGNWFDLIWLPPSAKSSGGTGYIPLHYSNQNSDWGTSGDLKLLIAAYHRHGARVVADIVANHIGGKSGWCDYYQMTFGVYGSFQPQSTWICSTDEAFTEGHCSGTPGNADDGYGSEANYGSARDWDHTNADVRNMMRAYLKWMRNVMGYDGWRYDYCKGFHLSHVNEYNTASEAYFSVMEYWDGNPDVLQSRLTDAGWNTATFDFGVKYQALNDGIAAGNYAGCRNAGLLGKGKGRYAVTFVDSHDSYQRDGNEFMGAGNSMKNYDDKTLQANAYILSMPGTPCVFYPHWVTWKTQIKAMINARYKTGVHSESAVTDEVGNGFYKATITGTNGSIRLLLGPNSDYGTTPAGYTLATKGTNWGVYYKLNEAKGDKDASREPVVVGVESVPAKQVHPSAQKVMIDGQMYVIFEGKRYTIMGQIAE